MRVDDPEQVVRVATFDSADEAKSLVAELKDALTEMTKSQFEALYFQDAETGDTGVE